MVRSHNMPLADITFRLGPCLQSKLKVLKDLLKSFDISKSVCLLAVEQVQPCPFEAISECLELAQNLVENTGDGLCLNSDQGHDECEDQGEHQSEHTAVAVATLTDP